MINEEMRRGHKPLRVFSSSDLTRRRRFLNLCRQLHVKMNKRNNEINQDCSSLQVQGSEVNEQEPPRDTDTGQIEGFCGGGFRGKNVRNAAEFRLNMKQFPAETPLILDLSSHTEVRGHCQDTSETRKAHV